MVRRDAIILAAIAVEFAAFGVLGRGGGGSPPWRPRQWRWSRQP